MAWITNLIGIDPAWVANWVLYLTSAWLRYVPLILIVVGGVLMYQPAYRQAWVVEVGRWLVVAGALLVAISGVWTLLDSSWPAAALLAALVVAYAAYWLMPSHRRIEVKTEAVIRAQPESVFFIATDPGVQLRLHSTLAEMSVKGGGALGLGSIVVSREKPARGTEERIVVGFDPPRRYSTQWLDAAPNRTTLSFESTTEGTRLLCEYLALIPVADALLMTGFRKSHFVRHELAYREQWFDALRQEAAREPD